MTQSIRKKVLTICLSVLAFVSVAAAIAFGTGKAFAKDYKLTDELFDCKFVSVETGVKTPADLFEEDGRAGTTLTANAKNAKAILTQNFAGKFSLDYRFIKYAEAAYGVTEAKVTFTALDTSESFAVKISNSAIKRGYSVIGEGGSFSVNGAEAVFVTGNASDTLVFDPNTLTVSVNGEKIWSFANFKNGDYKASYIFDGFSKYSVTIDFTDAKEDGGMLVYSLGGQKLNERVMHKNIAAPEIYAPLKANAIAGVNYAIPAPVVFDMIDGEIAEENVTVKIAYGAETKFEGKYTAGLTFTPEKTGNYSVTYTVKDSDGLENMLVQSFTALNASPECKFNDRGVIRDYEIGTGTVLPIARVFAVSDFANGRDPYVYVYMTKNGAAYPGFAKSPASGFDYAFTSAGEYVVYFAADFGNVTKAIAMTVNVTDELPEMVLSESIPEYVLTGSRYKLPDATFKMNGVEVKADKTVTFPSGTVYAANYIDLKEYGYYTITYTAAIGENEYTEEITFKSVTTPMDTVSGNVALEVGEYRRAGTVKKGLVVTESSGQGGVTFNYPIDVTNAKKGDTLVDVAAFPFNIGVRDYNQLFIDFTDINDPDNVVSIRVVQPGWMDKTRNECYAKASHSGLEYVGVHSEEKNEVYRGDNNWGYYMLHPFYGNDTTSLEDGSIKVSMDYERKRLYIDTSYSKYCDGMIGDGAMIDLSSLSYFTKEWKGFSEGKCYISVRTGNLMSSEGRYIISSIGGYDLTGDYLGYTAPAITVNYNGYENSVPDGVKDVAYPVFTASAKNIFGENVPVTTKVFFEYGVSGEIEIDVKNGAFVPQGNGTYRVEYTAKDGLNNIASKWFEVNVGDKDRTLTASANAGADNVAGTFVKLRDYTASGAYGNTEIASVTVTEKDTGAAVKVENGEFYAEKAVIYAVRYTVKDFLGYTAEVSYDEAVAASSSPVFDGEVNLLPVYEAGKTYSLPEITAHIYGATGAEAADVTVKARYADGTEEAITDINAFVPVIVHGNTFTVIYTAAKGGAESEISATAYVADTAKQDVLVMSNYFAKQNVEFTAGKKNTTVKVTDASKPAEFVFAKPVLVNSFGLRLNVIQSENNFNACKITLTDAQNPAVKVTLKIVKDGKTSKMYINGSSSYSVMVGSFWGSDAELGSTYDMQINYKNSTRQIFDATQNSIGGISKDLAGNAFAGFPSGEVYVGFEFEGITGDSAISLISINNQTINNAKVDVGAPELVINGACGGIVEKGSTAVIPSAFAKDVLSEVKSVTVTMTNAAGGFVTATDGTVLNAADASKEYTVTFNDYGRYMVKYLATDMPGNVAGGDADAKLFYVFKNEPLNYTINGTVATTAKVGDTVTLPELTSEDENVTYSIIVYDPIYSFTLVYNHAKKENYPEKKYTFTMKGEYKVRYYVHDDFYNTEIKDFIVNVG